ncbi:hypothetical protein TNCV_3488171 [Trichonephila clavipes]|nr:hypothetical protein TNCV_3488171 [Trichonephila clavipes]
MEPKKDDFSRTELNIKLCQCLSKTPMVTLKMLSRYEVKAVPQEPLREVVEIDFQLSFQKLYERWQKCIFAQEDYFESGCVTVL